VSTAPTPPVDFITAELWECDGCGYTDRLQAVNAHVEDCAYWADGTPKHIADVVCWGALLVGSTIWLQWHFEDVHPMHGIVGMIRDTVARFGMDDICGDPGEDDWNEDCSCPRWGNPSWPHRNSCPLAGDDAEDGP
jgi:hypothetical protein